MLHPSTPFWGLPCGVPRFWRLRVTKDFSKPKYFIGQSVAHPVNWKGVKTCIPVTAIGLAWSGMDWEYLIEIPKWHPWFRKDDGECHWVNESEITSNCTSVNLIESVGAQKQKLIASVGEQ